MDESMKFTLTLFAGAAFIAALAGFLVLIFAAEAARGTAGPMLLIILVPFAGITLTMALLLSKKRKSRKSGIPLEDEMSQRIKDKAGYKAYIFTSWAMIGLMFYLFLTDDYGFPPLSAETVIYAVLLCLFASYFVTWAALSRKGLK